MSKKWTLIFSPKADKEFSKLDKAIQKRIIKSLVILALKIGHRRDVYEFTL